MGNTLLDISGTITTGGVTVISSDFFFPFDHVLEHLVVIPCLVSHICRAVHAGRKLKLPLLPSVDLDSLSCKKKSPFGLLYMLANRSSNQGFFAFANYFILVLVGDHSIKKPTHANLHLGVAKRSGSGLIF